MNESVLGSLVLLLMCGFAAYRLMKWLWPIIEQRKNLPAAKMVERAILAPMEERQRQAIKYGSFKKTFVVNVVTLLLAAAWLYTMRISPNLFLSIFVYVCLGFVLIHFFRVPKTDDLADLNLSDRFTLRLFHAWLWPIYVIYAARQK